jgi:hypothetical protein
MSFESAISSGYNPVRPPARNSSAMSSGEHFFNGNDTDEASDADDPGNPGAPEARPLKKHRVSPLEDDLERAFDPATIRQGGMFEDFMQKMRAHASDKSDGPFMAVKEVFPQYINGYNAIVACSKHQSVGLSLHKTQKKAIEALFWGIDGAGPLCRDRDDKRIREFFSYLEEIAASMKVMVDQLSKGWSAGLEPVGGVYANTYTVSADVPDASFLDWCPTDGVYIARVLANGESIRAHRDQVLRSARSGVPVADDLLQTATSEHMSTVKTLRNARPPTSKEPKKLDGRKAYPVMGRVPYEIFKEYTDLFVACREANFAGTELTVECAEKIRELSTRVLQPEKGTLSVQDAAIQYEFECRLQNTMSTFTKLMHTFNADGVPLVEEGPRRELVFILTGLQNNQSVHVEGNNREATWWLKILHEVLRIYDGRLRDKPFRFTEGTEQPFAHRSALRQQFHANDEDPYVRISMLIVYLITERMSILYKIRHNAFRAADRLDPEWDVSNERCQFHSKHPDMPSSSCSNGNCTSKQTTALQKKFHIHKGDSTTMAEVFHGARPTTHDHRVQRKLSNPPKVQALLRGPPDAQAHCTPMQRTAIDAMCVIVGRILNNPEYSPPDIDSWMCDGDDDEDDDGAGGEGDARGCTGGAASSSADVGGSSTQTVEEAREEHSIWSNIKWMLDRSPHSQIVRHLDMLARKVETMIRYIDKLCGIQSRVEALYNERCEQPVEEDDMALEMCTDTNAMHMSSACETASKEFRCTAEELLAALRTGSKWRWKHGDFQRTTERVANLKSLLETISSYRHLVEVHDSPAAVFFDFTATLKKAVACACQFNGNAEVIKVPDDYMQLRNLNPQYTVYSSKHLQWVDARLSSYREHHEHFRNNMISGIRNAFFCCMDAAKVTADTNPNEIRPQHRAMSGIGVSCILSMLAVAYDHDYLGMYDTIEEDRNDVYLLYAIGVPDPGQRRIEIAEAEKWREHSKTETGWSMLCTLAEIAYFVATKFNRNEYRICDTYHNMGMDQARVTLSSGVDFVRVHPGRLSAWESFMEPTTTTVQKNYPSRPDWSFADSDALDTKEKIKTFALWTPSFLHFFGFINVPNAKSRPASTTTLFNSTQPFEDTNKSLKHRLDGFYRHEQFGDDAAPLDAVDDVQAPPVHLPSGVNDDCDSGAFGSRS